jgi:hypothetical protein
MCGIGRPGIAAGPLWRLLHYTGHPRYYGANATRILNGLAIAWRAAAFLKHKLRDTEVTYPELAKKLKKHGFKAETEASITG